MTERMRAQVIEWAKLIGAAAVITSVATTVLSAIIAVAFQLWGATLLSMAGVATAHELARVTATVNELLRTVTILARPDQIVHYRDYPFPLGGSCSPGNNCTIVVFAERDLRAIECQIIPGSAQLLATQGGRTYTVAALVGKSAVNLGPSPRAVEPTFLLPKSLALGEATARIETSYTDCLWQVDGEPPATQASPEFRIDIVEAPSP